MKTIIFKLPVISKFISFNKREKFVLSVFSLTLGFFIFEFFGIKGLKFGFSLGLLTDIFLFLILRKDIKDKYTYPIFILPFLYTIAFGLFYLLFPARLLPKIIVTIVYAFGLYSLFLTQNILAVSSVKAINLLRSARIVLFVMTLIILFFLLNFIFQLHLKIVITPLLIFILSFTLNLQSLWFYSINKNISNIVLYSIIVSLIVAQISFILAVWPVDATIYSICLTGIFYVFSGLSHSWIEGRLFKGILWEYIWVAFLSILILISFSKWGF